MIDPNPWWDAFDLLLCTIYGAGVFCLVVLHVLWMIDRRKPRGEAKLPKMRVLR